MKSNILTKQHCICLFWEKKCHMTRVAFQANQITIQSDNITTANQINRIDFFIFDNMSGGHNTMYQFDVYQQKTKQHFNASRSLASPNNPKNSYNCTYSTRLYKDPDGFKELYMDN